MLVSEYVTHSQTNHTLNISQCNSSQTLSSRVLEFIFWPRVIV